MSLSTFVTAIIGNGPIRDEFAHRVMVQSLMETPRFYLLHTLNPQLSWGELQLRGSAKGKLTKAGVWSSSRLIFHQFWIYPVKLDVLFGLCLGLWAGPGALESFIILTGTDTSGVGQATSLRSSSLGEQLCANRQLCVILYGSSTPSPSLNMWGVESQRPSSTALF